MTLRLLTAAALAAATTGVGLATSLRFTPIPERVATADLVVLGTVTGVEEKASDLDSFGVGKAVKLRVATVQVRERLFGEAADTLRVGFIGKEDQPNDGLRIPTPVLEPGAEVLLFLEKRAGEHIYRVPGHFGAVGKGVSPHLGGDPVAAAVEARAACKVLANAPAALKSVDPDERMTAAFLLTLRYRNHPFEALVGKAKQVEISTEESRAILDGLLLLADRNRDGFFQAAHALGVGREVGSTQPFTPETARAWIAAHRDSYRVKKHVLPAN